MCLIAKYIRYHLLNFVAMDLQLYKIFKIHESDFLAHIVYPTKVITTDRKSCVRYYCIETD